jgi:Replication protein C (RepC)
MDFDLTHVRHDPAHCLAPGLFRSLKSGDRKKLKLDVMYRYGENEQIEFKGPEPLGVDDLRILQGLIAMAGPKGVVLTSEPKSEAGKQLRLFLEPKWEAVQQDALVVKGSYRHLAYEIGYTDIDGGNVFRLIRACLERLWTVSIIVQIGRRRMGFKLLSEYASDEADGKLFIALNPRIAEAILGRRPHARIEMGEVRALKTDPARLMHQRLCGWIDPGKLGRIGLDTICGYVWPDVAQAEAMKKRRQSVRKALAELVAVGWTISEYAKGKFEITRPKSSVITPLLPSGEVPLLAHVAEPIAG